MRVRVRVRVKVRVRSDPIPNLYIAVADARRSR